MTLDDDLPPILTVDQTAQVLGISRGLAFTAVRAGDIPSIRIGRRILVLRDRLRQMLGVDPAEAAAANQADSP
jgi:excisionase family DNA binding protein